MHRFGERSGGRGGGRGSVKIVVVRVAGAIVEGAGAEEEEGCERRRNKNSVGSGISVEVLKLATAKA